MGNYHARCGVGENSEITSKNYLSLFNGWDDIAVTYTDGHIEKAKEHFYNPQHAVDVVKRLLHHSGMIIDNATPMSQGHLPGNTRITALKEPLVDDDRGISVSIRLLHPSRVDMKALVKGGNATQKMIDFLCMCLRYGVSFVVAGATSSGKTTLLNALLSSVPDNKRIFTIESGSRELSLVKVKDGKVVNNVVHTLSRPSDNPAYDITQEDLVVASLRFNPDIVVVGEMRDTEAYSAVEASLTGHTVVSTIHASAAVAAHMRLGLLCQKRFPINFATSLMQAGQAFPLVVYAHKLEDNSRKIMDISECVITPSGEREYHTLFRFRITKNELKRGKYKIDGYFEQPEIKAKENLVQYSNVNLICGNFLTHSFLDQFDVIYSSLTFMHIKEKQDAIDKVFMLLKDGGRFILSIDKNQDECIDMGLRKIKIFPDDPLLIERNISKCRLNIVECFETELAYIHVAVKEV